MSLGRAILNPTIFGANSKGFIIQIQRVQGTPMKCLEYESNGGKN
jgi:hypothetical protein